MKNIDLKKTVSIANNIRKDSEEIFGEDIHGARAAFGSAHQMVRKYRSGGYADQVYIQPRKPLCMM